jgi:hypothetical protein
MSKRSKPSVWSKGARNSISGPFAARLYELLISPAYKALSLTAHRVLSRIEIEHLRHRQKTNGRLAVTYDQFAEYGVYRKAISSALRELQALGLIEITQQGCGGNSEFKQMSLYRLTYRNAEGAPADGSHEWRRIPDRETAEAIAKEARQNRDKNNLPGAVSTPGRGVVSTPINRHKPSRVTVLADRVAERKTPAIASRPAVSGPNGVTVHRGVFSTPTSYILATEGRASEPAPGTPGSVTIATKWPANSRPSRRCEACGEVIAAKRPQARFCSGACRQRAVRAAKQSDVIGA